MAAKDDKNRKSDKKKSDKPGLIERIKKFFKSLKTEFKKIVWPNRSQLVKQTIAVLLIILCFAFALLTNLVFKEED